MFLWIALALMTGAAVMTVLWPLSAKGHARAAGSGDVAFYKDQLAEIDRDAARGILDPGETELARAEAARRLIRADAAAGALSAPGTGEPALRRRRAASALALSLVPIVGLALYGALGSPNLVAAPPGPDPTAAAPGDLSGALARLEAHLLQNPEDGRGWDVIAPVYLRTGRPDDAERAYASAIRIGGETADRLAGLGESLVGAAGGVVTGPARAAFDKAFALDPASPGVGFYRALALEQDGDGAGAIDSYRALVAAAPVDAPWRPLVEGRLARLAPSTSRLPAARLPAEAVTPEIAAMVGRLDARLGESGGSEAEWDRLIRSYLVLGQSDRARDRLRRARVALAGDEGAAARLDRMSRDLGLLPEGAGR